MNSRIVIALISVFMMLASSLPAFGLSLSDIPEVKEVSEELDLALDENENAVFFYTKGPVKCVASIELIRGNQTQIEKINEILSKCPKIRSRVVAVENLTFRINYTKRVFPCSRYRYKTMIISPNAEGNESTNCTIVKNRKHEVIVNDFTGMFIYIRPKVFTSVRFKLFQPAQFVFIGKCKSAILTKY